MTRLLAAAILSLMVLVILATPSHAQQPQMQKRWLFVWRNMGDSKEVDRTIALFPRAQAAGYNGVALSHNIPAEKAAELRAAAAQHGLDLIAIVMNGTRDRNYMEGVPVKNTLFVAHDGVATLRQDNPTKPVNADFEDVRDHHFNGWRFQDDEGVTTFADHEVFHGGQCSLRMESIGKNEHRHCRIMQNIKLQPFRQYAASVWIKTENLRPADPEIKLIDAKSGRLISYQTFRVKQTQDWTQHHIVFNSLTTTDVNFYLGSWWGKDGKVWWDDLKIEELGLVNVLRRPGCPVVVKGETGTVYEEGKDFEPIKDPRLHPWIPYHEQPPIKLTDASRIKDGDRLRVSYYHPLVIYDDRLTCCMSEPKIFEDWTAEIQRVNELLHPAAFLMSHDELRVMNWCAACQALNMTPGQLLAWNVRKCAGIIRDLRPDAGIWVWNDMFDPLHNAKDDFYLVNGSLKGSWEGLDKDVGIVNWYGSLMGKNCQFFADLGLRQILSGYYDSDEDGARIAKWEEATKDVPGIVGAMYTTWEDKYGAMEAWANRAWEAVPNP
ncbi:MAG: carbohydrate binding domain-containing protein [Armatimonadetes bacterium]|nr:carbohydrate binding domain-containing protein [Armatimonadota bacterium]